MHAEFNWTAESQYRARLSELVKKPGAECMTIDHGSRGESTYILTAGLLDALADRLSTGFGAAGCARLCAAQAAILVAAEDALRFYARFDTAGEILIEPLEVDLDQEEDFRPDLFPVVVLAYDDHRVCAVGSEFQISGELLAERERFRAPLVDFWC